jgi:plastocyanin
VTVSSRRRWTTPGPGTPRDGGGGRGWARRTGASGATLLVAGLALAACGATPAHPGHPGHASTTTTASSPATSASEPKSENAGVDPGHLVPAGPGPTTMPTEDPITPIRSGFDTGQQVAITAHGFEPLQLSATPGEAIVWTNVSGVPQTVVIGEASVRSPTIPPGAQFVWKPNFGGYIGYTSEAGFRATLIVQ